MNLRKRVYYGAFACVSIVIMLFILFPLLVVLVQSFERGSSTRFPPTSFSLHWYSEVFTSNEWVGSFEYSGLILCSVVPLTTIIATLSGVGITRGRFPFRNTISAMLMSPLMVPEVLTGVGVLIYLQSIGLVGTYTGIVITQSIIALPFAFRSIVTSASAIDPSYERAAKSLGAGPVRVAGAVLLPLLRPGIVSAAVLSGIISLGEVAVTEFIIGPRRSTIPINILSSIQFQFEPTILAAASILVGASVGVVLVLNRLVKLTDIF